MRGDRGGVEWLCYRLRRRATLAVLAVKQGKLVVASGVADLSVREFLPGLAVEERLAGVSARASPARRCSLMRPSSHQWPQECEEEQQHAGQATQGRVACDKLVFGRCLPPPYRVIEGRNIGRRREDSS